MGSLLDELAARDDIRVIADLAAGLGVEAFLVGGGVRDCLLGRETNDLDFALTGACDELPRLFAARAGATFFWLDAERQQARVVRKTVVRSVVYDFAPVRGGAIAADLALRDFTINALALPLTGRVRHLLDPLDGRGDLRKGVIRACSAGAFDDDPLRLMRALRFAAELGFTLDDGTWDALCRKAALLGNVAAERIRDELFRILAAPPVGDSLRRLDASGLWQTMFAESAQGVDGSAGGGRGPVPAARIGIVEALEVATTVLVRHSSEEGRPLEGYLEREVEAGMTVRALLRLAAFVGSGEGVKVAAVAERLRLGKSAGRILELFTRDERPLFGILEKNVSERPLYRFFRDRGPAGLGMVILGRARGDVSAQCASRLAAYYFAGYDPKLPDLFLSGDEIMTILGAPPGTAVGEAMARLRTAEASGAVGSKEDAREFIKNLLTREPLMR